jgi:hypothetical protein
MPYLMNLVHLLQHNNPLTTGSLRELAWACWPTKGHEDAEL